jgi:hypothetical protein
VYGIREFVSTLGDGAGAGSDAVEVSVTGAGAAHGARVSSFTAVALSPPPQKLAPHVCVNTERDPGPITLFFSAPSLSRILQTAQSLHPSVRQILS